MNRVSKKKKADNALYAKARVAVMLRCGGLCEICGQWMGDDVEIHHRKRRSQGGTHALDNLMAIHSEEHHRIHANPYWALEKGYLLPGGTHV